MEIRTFTKSRTYIGRFKVCFLIVAVLAPLTLAIAYWPERTHGLDWPTSGLMCLVAELGILTIYLLIRPIGSQEVIVSDDCAEQHTSGKMKSIRFSEITEVFFGEYLTGETRNICLSKGREYFIDVARYENMIDLRKLIEERLPSSAKIITQPLKRDLTEPLSFFYIALAMSVMAGIFFAGIRSLMES